MPSDSKNNRVFQFLLLILGFVFGVFGSYFLYHIDNNSRKEQTALFLKSTIEAELSKNESMIKVFQSIVDSIEHPLMAKETFSWIHDNTILNSLGTNLSLLEPEITNEFARYYYLSNQCIAEANYLMRTLDTPKKYSEVDKKILKEYINIVKLFNNRADSLLNAINKYY